MADSRADELPTDGNTVSQSAKDGGDNAGIPIIVTSSSGTPVSSASFLLPDHLQLLGFQALFCA
ncbi:hypothetical protein Vi05172_g11872 [Venturia inaequalis]|nr:hypothetical protein Vi05172_g11872 [Venturia inaequalis]